MLHNNLLGESQNEQNSYTCRERKHFSTQLIPFKQSDSRITLKYPYKKINHTLFIVLEAKSRNGIAIKHA